MARPISAGKRDMILNGNLIRAILTLAIPVMINSFIQSMYNLTDTFWLGKIGTANQAAITLVSPFQNILINFGAGITTAGAILISQYLGAKEDKQANSMANHICITSLGFSVVCAFICWLVSPGLVKWLGADGDIYRYGLTYIRIVVLDLPFLFMINLFTSVKQAQGDTVRPLLLNILGVSINLILDPLFLVIFNWGIGGSTMQFGFLLMTKNVNAYGPTATTAYGIGNKINSIITMPANGIGSAISTIVGQNMGAGNIKRTDKSYHIALRIGAVFLFICGMILSRRFIAEPMVRFFTSDEQVVPLATQFLSIMAICCWTNAFYNVTQGLFQGCGHTMITMAVDATRIWIFRFLTLWVCANVLGMGVESVWYAVVVSNATSALILYILYWTGIWKKSTIKIEKTQDEGNNSDEKVKSLNEADSDIKVSSNIQTVN